jgi:hypothetical protein
MRRLVSAVLLVLWLGCGGANGTDVRSENGPTRFTGTSSAFVRTQESVSGQPVRALYVGIFELPPGCSASDAGAPGTYGTITVGIVRPGTDPVGPGSWSPTRNVPGLLDGAFAQYQKWIDGQLSFFLEAVSGSIKLTRADDVTVDGELDVMLDDGTQLRGHFHPSGECLR